MTIMSLTALFAQAEVEHSSLGIAITALSVIVMPFLSFAERRAGRELGSATAVADSKQTLICTYLSAAVLIGLSSTPCSGGGGRRDRRPGHRRLRCPRRLEAWRGDACATSVGMLLEGEHDDDEHH